MAELQLPANFASVEDAENLWKRRRLEAPASLLGGLEPEGRADDDVCQECNAQNCLCIPCGQSEASTEAASLDDFGTAPETPRDSMSSITDVSTPLGGRSSASSDVTSTVKVSEPVRRLPRVPLQNVNDQPSCAGVLIQVQCLGPCCSKCKTPCDVFKARIYSKASEKASVKWICHKCQSVMKMLSRKIDLSGMTSFANMKPAMVTDFFEKALKIAGDGRLNYGSIRGVFKECMTHQTVQERRSKVVHNYKPLGVWEMMGYDIDAITNYNLTEDNAALGMTYAIPERMDSWEAIDREVEETIQMAERRAVGKKSKDDKSILDDWATEHDDQRSGHPSQGAQLAILAETEQDRTKRLVKEKQQAAKDVAAAAKAALAEQEKVRRANLATNNKIVALASRVVSCISPFQALIKQAIASKDFLHCPDVLKTALHEELNDIQVALSESNDRLKALTKVNKNGEVLNEMTLDSAGVQKLVADVKHSLKRWATIERMSL